MHGSPSVVASKVRAARALSACVASPPRRTRPWTRERHRRAHIWRNCSRARRASSPRARRASSPRCARAPPRCPAPAQLAGRPPTEQTRRPEPMDPPPPPPISLATKSHHEEPSSPRARASPRLDDFTMIAARARSHVHHCARGRNAFAQRKICRKELRKPHKETSNRTQKIRIARRSNAAPMSRRKHFFYGSLCQTI